MAAPTAEIDADPIWQRLMEIADGRLLLGKGETAKAIGIANGTLDDIVDAGDLRYVLVGKRRRFKPDDIARYIHKQERQCQSEEGPPDRSGGRSVASLSFGGLGKGSGARISMSRVIDFEEALALTARPKPKPSPPPAARKSSVRRSKRGVRPAPARRPPTAAPSAK